LRSFAQRYVQSLVDHKSSIQLSGLACTWKSVNGKPEIQRLKAGGEEVADGKRYVCATSDFVVNQADKYLGFTPANVTFQPQTVFQAMVAKVVKDKVINSQVENRFSETQ
jgi:hypothetical protein